MKRKILIHKRGTNTIIGEALMEIPDNEGNLSAEPYYISDIDITPLDFDAVKDQLIERVNAAAGRTRLRFITAAPGQAEVYILKLEQAKDFLANGGVAGEFELLEAEAYARNVNRTVAANWIIGKRDQWITIAAKIEKFRRRVIEKITIETVQETAYQLAEQAIFDLDGVNS